MTKRTKIIAFLLAGTLLTSCSVQKDDVAKKENVQPETNIEKKIDEDTNKEETAKLSIEEVRALSIDQIQ